MWIMVICLVVLIGWDIFAATNKTKGDTESEIVFMLAVTQGHWGIATALGGIVGHFVSQQRRQMHLLASVGYGLCICGGFELLGQLSGFRHGAAVSSLVGFIYGYIFWAQGTDGLPKDNEDRRSNNSN
jgi:hypothetical protein